jgi:hypothetical protein
MKTIKIQFKSVALILSILILLQGCSVYHKGTRTLEQAVQEQKKLKITTLDNRTMHFKKVVYKNGKYYGVKKIKDSTKDVWLFENDIKELKGENKTMSIVVSSLPVTIPLLLLGTGYLFWPKTFGPY